jgi:L-asparaginase II
MLKSFSLIEDSYTPEELHSDLYCSYYKEWDEDKYVKGAKEIHDFINKTKNRFLKMPIKEAISIADILSNDTYIIPIYQRNYEWEQEQISKLIDDINSIDAGKNIISEHW